MAVFSPWMGVGEGVTGSAGGIGDLLLRKKLLEMQLQDRAQRLALEQQQLGLQREQMGLQREQLGIDRPYKEALTKQAGAHTSALEGGESREKAIAGRAENVGDATMLWNALQDPMLQDYPNIQGRAALMANAQGLIPLSMRAVSPGTLGAALAAIIRGQSTATGVSTPGTAAQLVRPLEVSPGSVVGQGLPGWQEMFTAPNRPLAGGTIRTARPGDWILGPQGEKLGEVPKQPGTDTKFPLGALFTQRASIGESPWAYTPDYSNKVDRAASLALDAYLKGFQQKPAMGGYEIGKQYGNLIYQGGDPYDSANWIPVP